MLKISDDAADNYRKLNQDLATTNQSLRKELSEAQGECETLRKEVEELKGQKAISPNFREYLLNITDDIKLKMEGI